jgi:hypothetical protein
MKELCKRLTEGTGLDFKVSSDTCEPFSCDGSALNYWITTMKNGFMLEATAPHGEVFSGNVSNESELIDKIISLENQYK